jgi:hypothetical protein
MLKITSLFYYTDVTIPIKIHFDTCNQVNGLSNEISKCNFKVTSKGQLN